MSVFPDVLSEVNRLKKLYPTYAVKTTGHSLGAALAQLTAMELINNGIHTTMINFGQPRVGDSTYAAYSNGKLEQYRVVHDKDLVPHNPTMDWPLNFMHSKYEMWETSKGVK